MAFVAAGTDFCNGQRTFGKRSAADPESGSTAVTVRDVSVQRSALAETLLWQMQLLANKLPVEALGSD